MTEPRAPEVPLDMVDEGLPRCENEGCRATLGESGRCEVCERGGMGSPERAWRAFVDSRPENVRATIQRHHLAPNRYYKLAETGDDYYQLYSVSEDATVTVLRYDSATNEPMWRVFGIDPAALILWRERPWHEFATEA